VKLLKNGYRKGKVMEQEATPTTKEALLLAAGELFAENGVEGTSIRAIAEKCQANIAAVNYHFGSKESLYVALVRYVLEKIKCYRAEDLLQNKQEWAQDPIKCAEAVYQIVEERCQQYLTSLHPHWYSQLFMRILLQPTPAVSEIIKDIVIPEYNAIRDVLRCCRPEMGVEEAELWTDTLMSQLVNYIFAEDLMQLFPEPRKFNSTFQNRIIRHVSKVLIRGLKLPMPSFLEEGTSYA